MSFSDSTAKSGKGQNVLFNMALLILCLFMKLKQKKENAYPKGGVLKVVQFWTTLKVVLIGGKPTLSQKSDKGSIDTKKEIAKIAFFCCW